MKVIDTLNDRLAYGGPGGPTPPSFWPSESGALIKNADGTTTPYGKCRRATFFRYLLSIYAYYVEHFANVVGDEFAECVSDIGMSCDMSFLNQWSDLIDTLKQYPDEPDPYLRWIWASGELAEEHIIELAKGAGIYDSTQIRVSVPIIDLSGKIDIIVISEDYLYQIVEVKSVYGHNAKSVIGHNGVPKDSNLMQVALYQWYHRNRDDFKDYASLVYVARDTGVFGEYHVSIGEKGEIYYQNVAPVYFNKKVTAPYTIKDILNNFKEIKRSIIAGEIPEPWYQLVWSDERIDDLYAAGKLNAADTQRYEKIDRRNAYNEFVRQITDGDLSDSEILARAKEIAETGELRKSITSILDSDSEKALKALKKLTPKQPIKSITSGDWQCRRCRWKDYCYPQQG